MTFTWEFPFAHSTNMVNRKSRFFCPLDESLLNGQNEREELTLQAFLRLNLLSPQERDVWPGPLYPALTETSH